MKTKKMTTKVICAILALVTVFGCVCFAVSTMRTEKIEVVYNDVKIVVDGKVVEPKDANGNKVEPFIYNGTTYLPVRAVGQAVGKDVNWDAETKTVYLGEMPAPEVPAEPEPKPVVKDTGYSKGYQTLYSKVLKEGEVWGMSLDDGITFGFVISDEGDLSWCVDSKYDGSETFTSLFYDENADTITVMMKTDISGVVNYTSAEIYPSTYNTDTNPYVYNLETDATWADEETLEQLLESSVKIIFLAAEIMIYDIDLTMADLGFTAY